MADPAIAEILEINQQLLECIAVGDWKTYETLCDPTLTCFEPEARGHLVQGMDFHRFYFDLGPSKGPRTTTMASPHVRVMGDSAVISYIRLVQRLDENESPATIAIEETRIWQLQNGQWRHVHFHRSSCD